MSETCYEHGWRAEGTRCPKCAESKQRTAFTVDDGLGAVFIKCAGMSLRDYFAAQIVCGFVAQTNILSDANSEYLAQSAFVNAAAFSYRLADAMLAERAK